MTRRSTFAFPNLKFLLTTTPIKHVYDGDRLPSLNASTSRHQTSRFRLACWQPALILCGVLSELIPTPVAIRWIGFLWWSVCLLYPWGCAGLMGRQDSTRHRHRRAGDGHACYCWAVGEWSLLLLDGNWYYWIKVTLVVGKWTPYHGHQFQELSWIRNIGSCIRCWSLSRIWMKCAYISRIFYSSWGLPPRNVLSCEILQSQKVRHLRTEV